MNKIISVFITTMIALLMPALSSAAINEVLMDPYNAHIPPSDNASLEYTLPFTFPFDGRNIVDVCVYTDGLIELLESGETCTLTDAAGIHQSGVPSGMDAVLIANDDLTTGVVINGFSDKVIISYTGSTTADNGDFYDGTIQMQVILYSDGRIHWNFFSMDYNSHSYDLFSGIHLADGTELVLPILDECDNNDPDISCPLPPDGIPDEWPWFELLDRFYEYQFDGTTHTISFLPFNDPSVLYDDYVLMFNDAYQEFNLPFSFPYFGRSITGIAVNTNGLIELLEAGESAKEFGDDYTYTYYDPDVEEDICYANPVSSPDGVPDHWFCSGYNLYYGPVGTHFNGNHILNIDSIFLANDDLVTGTLINGDLNRVVITLSGIIYDNKFDFTGKPLQMQVILFANGDILWNFFTMNWTSIKYDIFSGLYDEVGNIEMSLPGGTPQGLDIMRSFIFAPLLTDIKANGSDEPIVISSSDILSITVSLNPGSSINKNADWWVVADTPMGWYYYNLSSGWRPGQSVTYQGPLSDLSPYEVLNMSGLPVGLYTFYFGVDMIMNGSVDMSQMYYDSVEVNIQ